MTSSSSSSSSSKIPNMKNVEELIKILEVDEMHDPDIMNQFQECENLQDEFKIIRKSYLKCCLKKHPDKNKENPNATQDFQILQAAYETLSHISEQNKMKSFIIGKKSKKKFSKKSCEESFKVYFQQTQAMPTPSWEYYAPASADTVDPNANPNDDDDDDDELPSYRVELAKSGRAKCTQKGKAAKKCGTDDDDKKIEKGSVRIGSVIKHDCGISYGYWVHINCWKVPSKIWDLFPDPSIVGNVSDSSTAAKMKEFETAFLSMENLKVLGGFAELPQDKRDQIIHHAMDNKHWAQKRGGNKRISTSTAPPHETAMKKEEVKPNPTVLTEIDVNMIHHHQQHEQGEKQKKKSSRKNSKKVKNESPKTESEESSELTLVIPKLIPKSELALSIPINYAKTESEESSELPLPHFQFPLPIPKKETQPKFIIPQPGVNGATPYSLQGKSFVISGVFPEIGGKESKEGKLNQGKTRVKTMIEAFGGRVVSAVSGKTDFLVVGKDPGASKVTKARFSPKCELIGLKDLADCLVIGDISSLTDDSKPKMQISSFSNGFSSGCNGGNGLAQSMSTDMLAIAAGTVSPPKAILPAKKKRNTGNERIDTETENSITVKRKKTEKKGKPGKRKINKVYEGEMDETKQNLESSSTTTKKRKTTKKGMAKKKATVEV